MYKRQVTKDAPLPAETIRQREGVGELKFGPITYTRTGEYQYLSLIHISSEFEYINGLHVRFILWTGDDEFPPASQILFEDNFPYAYQAEDLAVVGDISITTLKILAGK